MSERLDIKTLNLEREPLKALGQLEHALAEHPADPDYASYLGVLVARERGQHKKAVRLCRQAVDDMPQRGDYHLNLCRALLLAGRKRAAVQALFRGLERCPEDTGLQELRRQLGVRRRPVFPCLARQHPLNKYLGKLAVRLGLR